MTQHLTIPLPPAKMLRDLSPNGRAYWSARVRARKLVEAIVAITVAIQGVQPQPTPCVLQATWVFPEQRRRDQDNLTALLKPFLDALVRARVLADDSVTHLTLAPVQVVVEPGVRELRITLEAT